MPGWTSGAPGFAPRAVASSRHFVLSISYVHAVSDTPAMLGRATLRSVVDSHLPRFSQALQALILAVAFLLLVPPVVPLMAVILAAAVFGGPKLNLWAHLYRALPIPRGEPEPAAPPRFAQFLGAIFLTIGTLGLWLAAEESTAWWVVGWGPALMVAVLAGVAATTSF